MNENDLFVLRDGFTTAPSLLSIECVFYVDTDDTNDDTLCVTILKIKSNACRTLCRCGRSNQIDRARVRDTVSLELDTRACDYVPKKCY